MDFHLDYGLHLVTEPKHKGLYSWAINEVDSQGTQINRDQIPWGWTIWFSATSCMLTDRLEIGVASSIFSENEGPPQIEADQVLRLTLRPGLRVNGEFVDDVTFSMFGTERVIQDFSLEVRPLEDATKQEFCNAWGSVSYTAEIDFHEETTKDCILFYLYVKPEMLARYISAVDRNAIDTVIFGVGLVDGFYSEWSPSVTTSKVKVLAKGSEQKLDLPPDFPSEPPRLGQVREARLLLQRRLELG